MYLLWSLLGLRKNNYYWLHVYRALGTGLTAWNQLTCLIMRTTLSAWVFLLFLL